MATAFKKVLRKS